LHREGLEGFEFTLARRTDALVAMTALPDSALSLTQAPRSPWNFAASRQIHFSLDVTCALNEASQSNHNGIQRALAILILFMTQFSMNARQDNPGNFAAVNGLKM